jgi:7-cyano-7-deazaguanine reductase
MKTGKINGLSLLGSNKIIPAKSPDDAVLESFENKYYKRDYEIIFDCPEFTALCPVTGQADFGTIKITYIPDRKCIESKSLKLFLHSFRNYNTFHEEAVNKILDKIAVAASPRKLEVLGIFRPRGGIAITVKVNYTKKGV